MSAFSNKCSWLKCPNPLTIRTTEKMAHEVFRPTKFSRHQFCSSTCCKKWMELQDAEEERKRQAEAKIDKYFRRVPVVDDDRHHVVVPLRGSG